jgi:hypothetical protein
MKATRAILGNEITDKLLPPEVWGLDSEGEIKQAYRPSGHPGLWFAMGSFGTARFLSKHLVSYLSLLVDIYLLTNAMVQGLQILARELGIA